MKMSAKEPLIFLFVGLTCGIYKSNLSLQGSLSSRWYENPDLPEVSALRDRYGPHKSIPTWHGTNVTNIAIENTTVAALSKFDNPHRIFNNRYVVDVKIKSSSEDSSWCYLACQICTSTILPRGDELKCTSPKCMSKSGSVRYRLSLLAVDPMTPMPSDEAPNIELVFFGPKAEEIIGVPINMLMAFNGGNTTLLPQRITTIYGKKFRVQISVSKASLQQKKIIYQVHSTEALPNEPIQVATAGEQKDAAGSLKESTAETYVNAAGNATLPLQNESETLPTMDTPASSEPVQITPPDNQATPTPKLHGRGQKRSNEELCTNSNAPTKSDATAQGIKASRRRLNFPDPQNELEKETKS